MQRCPQVENPGVGGGEGGAQVFAKIPGKIKAFRKNYKGGSIYFTFYNLFEGKTPIIAIFFYFKDLLSLFSQL
jgi:hypothetical protein